MTEQARHLNETPPGLRAGILTRSKAHDGAPPLQPRPERDRYSEINCIPQQLRGRCRKRLRPTDEFKYLVVESDKPRALHDPTGNYPSSSVQSECN